MSKVFSQTVETVSSNKEIEIAFEMQRGSEVITINDEMLTNYQVALARAESIFLEQSYKSKIISVTTYHINDINVGDIVRVDNVLYKIIKIVDSLSDASAIMQIDAERWE
jgi:hypothetical protein